MLLIRSKFDQNGKDANIQDYAGNGFFSDFSNEVSTQFWPRLGQYLPSASSIANFGDNTSLHTIKRGNVNAIRRTTDTI